MIRLSVILAMVFMSAAFAQETPLSNPEDEARAQALFAELRCMVCQNESIDASPSPFAEDVRAIVREQIASGRSNSEIKEFLTERYGEAILYRPRWSVSTLLLWLAPVFALLGGAVVVHSVLRRAGNLPPDL